MLNKALWLKDYKQSKFIIWAFWLVSLYVPYKFYQHVNSTEYHYDYWKEHLSKHEEFQYYFNWLFTEASFLQILVLITLASVLIGYERTNQSLDFTLSLPYRRKDIFLSKWIFGVVNIIVTLTICVLISFLTVQGTIVADFLPNIVFLYYYLTAITVLIGVYSFSLVLGLIAASVASQFVFSWIFLYLPFGLWVLIERFITFHTLVFSGRAQYFDNWLTKTLETISFPFILIGLDTELSLFVEAKSEFTRLPYLLIPLLVTLISVFGLISLSRNIKSESNGKLLVYEGLAPFLKVGVVVCFYLLGGMFFGDYSYSYEGKAPNLSSYHIGGIIMAAISYVFLSKLMGVKFQFGKK